MAVSILYACDVQFYDFIDTSLAHSFLLPVSAEINTNFRRKRLSLVHHTTSIIITFNLISDGLCACAY